VKHDGELTIKQTTLNEAHVSTECYSVSKVKPAAKFQQINKQPFRWTAGSPNCS